MKRKFTLLIAALALLTMIVQPRRAWGQTSVTFTAGVDTGATSVTKNGITVSMSTMSRTDNYRTYANSDMTVFSTVGNIQSVVVTCTANGTSNNGPGKFSVSANSSGSYTYESNGPNGTWTGASDEMALTASAQVRMTQIVVTYDDGGSTLEDNDIALTGAPVALSFDLYNNSSAQVINYTTSSTGAVTVSASDYVTTSVSGNTITVTPVAVTPSEQTITVSQAADATYAAGSATFTVNVTNSAPTVTVTYHANGGTGDNIEDHPYQGSNYTVAANTFSNPGYAFTEWNTQVDGDGDPYEAGDVIENISDNIDLYAQWEVSYETVDVLDLEFTGRPASTNYGDWSDKEGTSGAVYAGNSAGGNNAIQLRTTSYASGIVSTTSAGKVTKVEVQWNSNTSSGRKINIYGSNTAYTEASQLYNANTAGTLLGTIDYGSTTELTITGDYAYIGIRSQGNALYLDWVKITWATASSDVVATPVINPNGGSFWESQEVSISCATDGATIYYTTDGTDPTTGSAVYSASFTITATNTVKAFAVKADMTDSEIATAEFTKATPMTVPQALAVTPPQNGVYVGGIISEITEVSTQYHNATYKISDDGTHSSELTVFRGKYLNGANFTSEDQIQVGDVVVVYGDLGTYNEAIQLNQNNYLVSLVRPEKVATPTFSPAAGTYYAAQSVTIACETEGATIYYTTDGTDPTTESSVYSEAIAVNTTTTIKAFAVKEGINDSDIATAEYTIILTPSITVTPATANPSASDTEGTLDLTYANLTITDMDDFDIQYYDAGGDEATQPSWIEVGVAEQDPNIGEGYVVSYIMDANTVAEARTAYFKVYAMDGEEFVYSNLVTVTQAAFVVDYAELPFAFNGGRADIATTTGLTQEGLGSDYSNSPKLKFDGADDWVILKINERPGTLSFDIKGYPSNNVWSGTFKVQTSANGTNYTDLATYTDLTSTIQSEEFDNLDGDIRYIKWIYTNKDAGNVALGNISLAAYDYTPSITLESYSIVVDAAEHDGTLIATYKNIDFTNIPEIKWYESDGVTTATYNWLDAEINATTYNVDYEIGENTTNSERKAYFKVYGLDANVNNVYSGLVTVTQAAPAVAHSITIDNNIEHGTVAADPTSAVAGTLITLTVTPESGYQLASITATEVTSTNVIDLTQSGNNYTFDMPDDNVSVTATFTAIPVGVTYTLVETANDLVPGLHYIIAGKNKGEWFAMGAQNRNNRAAVSITVNDDIATVTSDKVYEFVISGDSDENGWTIYDESTESPGYLYAASSGSNHLKTRDNNNDGNSQWEITFDNGVASIVAQGSNTRKVMQFNTSGLFACYGSASQSAVYLYKKVGDTNPVYYSPTEIAVANPDPTSEPIIVVNNEILVLTGNLDKCNNPGNLIVEDGGQLVFSGTGVQATMKKSTAHAGAKDVATDWYTIASPLAANVATNAVGNLTNGTYDLYRYNEATVMWENAKDTEHSGGFNELTVGRGYLYWNGSGSDITFAGELRNDDVAYTLKADGAGNFKGFNLIGNPFSQNITMSNITGVTLSGGYVLTQAGGWGASIDEIAPCQGFLVQVKDETNITISKSIGSKSRANRDYIAFTVANNQYEDVAYAMFSNGLGLDKIDHRNAEIPMVYIPQNGQNYAIATMSDDTEMFNLNFKAMTTGQYTLSVDTKGNYSYLHIYDKMTNEDVDMLLEGGYSFIGSPRDAEDRFVVRLSYRATIDGNDTNNSFAYQYGNDIIVNGKGELQVFDVNGRMVMNTVINGKQTVNVPTTGLYIFRMIGESVKTQKIVVR